MLTWSWAMTGRDQGLCLASWCTGAGRLGDQAGRQDRLDLTTSLVCSPPALSPALPPPPPSPPPPSTYSEAYFFNQLADHYVWRFPVNEAGFGKPNSSWAGARSADNVVGGGVGGWRARHAVQTRGGRGVHGVSSPPSDLACVAACSQHADPDPGRCSTSISNCCCCCGSSSGIGRS